MISLNKSGGKMKKENEVSILKTSLALFCEQGYEAVTMDDIAKQAKLAKSTIYYSYFKSKLEIFVKILNNQSEELFKQLEEVKATRYLTKREKIDLLIKEFVKALSNPKNFWVLLSTTTSGDAEINKMLESFLPSFYHKYFELICSLFEILELPDPKGATIIFISFFDGIVLQMKYIPEVTKGVKISNVLKDFLFKQG